MSERFFHPNLAEEIVELDSDEAHHLRVSRVRPGDVITVFDGAGLEASCRVMSLDRRGARLRVEERRQIDRELLGRLQLFVPAPQGERQRWLVEKATELGVHQLHLIVTRHADRHSRGVRVHRMQRWVVEAAKQCGRNRLMEVSGPATWQMLCDQHAPESTARFFCHPSGRPMAEAVAEADYTEAYVAVGPEGGWSDDEVSAARDAGWQVVSLGPTILRTETAALAAICLARTKLIR